jgi:hypothetical protein
VVVGTVVGVHEAGRPSATGRETAAVSVTEAEDGAEAGQGHASKSSPSSQKISK